MSAEPLYVGWLDPSDGRCMAFPKKDGPRCPNPAAYVVDTKVNDFVLWCEAHTAATRREHPDFIRSVRTWRCVREGEDAPK
jgi:hypothetical protein